MAAFGRYALPCVLLGTLCAQQNADYESLLASAQQTQARSDFNVAASFYRQASALHPEFAELNANLGLMEYQANQNERAAEAFLQAIPLTPRLFVPNFFLGLDYVKLKRFNHAIPSLKQAARLKPEDIHVQMALGEAYSGDHNTRLAIRPYMRATEIEPGNADAWYRIGMSYLQQVEADARILFLRRKDSGYTQALLGENFAEQHAFNAAALSYQKTLSLGAVPPGTHAGYAIGLLSHGDLSGAERELKLEVAANPGSLLARLGRARLEVEQGSIQEVAAVIAQISNADPNYMTQNAQRFGTGLVASKRHELELALEKLLASGGIPEPAVSLFRSLNPGTTPLPRARSQTRSSKLARARLSYTAEATTQEQPNGRNLPDQDLRDTSVSQQFPLAAGEALHGLGQHQEGFFNLRDIPVELLQANSNIAIPFLISTNGFGLLRNNASLTDFDPATQEIHLNQNGAGTLQTGPEGDYGFLLSGNFRNKLVLSVHDQKILDLRNMWLPLSAGAKIHLNAHTTYQITAESGGDTKLAVRLPSNTMTFRSQVGDSVDYYFLYGPDPAQVIQEYRELTGAAPLLPKWAYGFWQCRERYSSQQQILDIAAEFRKRNIPVDVLVQDWQYWGKYGWNAMRFDESAYPESRRDDGGSASPELPFGHLHLGQVRRRDRC